MLPSKSLFKRDTSRTVSFGSAVRGAMRSNTAEREPS
jgi:hypothetical protein